MKLIKTDEVKKIFNLLNESNLDYIITRNIDNELPSALKIGKDIDILINKKNEKKLIHFFYSNDYVRIDHPFKHDVFLYGVDKFEFKYKNMYNHIDFDLVFQIAVRSLDKGQFIPLDKTIQDSAWKNKRFENLSDDFGYWALSYEDEFVCLVARSIFDKSKFNIGYIKRINKLINLIDQNDVLEKLNMIFFKFTPHLIKHIKEENYDEIITNYLKFKQY